MSVATIEALGIGFLSGAQSQFLRQSRFGCCHRGRKVVLMDDKLSKLAVGLGIARRILRIARVNIFFAISINSLCWLLPPLSQREQ